MENNLDEFRIVTNFINAMPKVYRERNDNASIVGDILMAGTSTSGRTSCIAKCRELGVDPYGYKFERE